MATRLFMVTEDKQDLTESKLTMLPERSKEQLVGRVLSV